MEAITQSLAQHSGQALLALCVLVGLLGAWVAFLYSKMRANSARWKDLMRGANGQNLENLLERHLDERADVKQSIRALNSDVDDLQSRMRTSKRHLGLVRYDAFEDVGGAQSFALALFDEDGDGAVVTSLVGRSDCRVYAKPLVKGRSERTLSQEEQRAIRDAEQTGPKSIVSS